jgi:1,4-alpha-glucan branching enzyme
MLKREISKDATQVRVTFIIPHLPNQPRVSVVGDFNNWDPNATPLIKRNNNTRSATVTLEAGKRYQFRYYDAGGQWFNDEQPDAFAPSEHGSENCVVIT